MGASRIIVVRWRAHDGEASPSLAPLSTTTGGLGQSQARAPRSVERGARAWWRSGGACAILGHLDDPQSSSSGPGVLAVPGAASLCSVANVGQNRAGSWTRKRRDLSRRSFIVRGGKHPTRQQQSMQGAGQVKRVPGPGGRPGTQAAARGGHLTAAAPLCAVRVETWEPRRRMSVEPGNALDAQEIANAGPFGSVKRDP